MIELVGKYTTAKIYSDSIEKEATSQIMRLSFNRIGHESSKLTIWVQIPVAVPLVKKLKL